MIKTLLVFACFTKRCAKDESGVRDLKRRAAMGLMPTLLLVSILTTFPVHAAPEIYMTPSNSPPHPGPYIGFRWNITIWIRGYGTPPIFAWSIRLNYDPAAGINITRAWRGRFDPAYIFSGRVTATCSIPVIGVGTVLAADALLSAPGERPPPDPAVLAIVEFEITDAPGKYEELYTDLEINNIDTYLLDDALNYVPVTKIDSSYTYAWPGCTQAYITVDPQYKEFGKFTRWNCTNFDIQVKIYSLGIGWNLRNVSFELSYNEVLTNLVTVTVDPLWSGPNTVDTSTLGVMSGSVSGPTSPPSEEIPILTVTFHIQGQGASPPRPVDAYDVSQLIFSDVKLLDVYGLIPIKPPLDGLVKVYAFVNLGDVNGDSTIDIRDMAEAAIGFGSYPGHPRWNPAADVNQDRRIGIADIALIAKSFGTTFP